MVAHRGKRLHAALAQLVGNLHLQLTKLLLVRPELLLVRRPERMVRPRLARLRVLLLALDECALVVGLPHVQRRVHRVHSHHRVAAAVVIHILAQQRIFSGVCMGIRKTLRRWFLDDDDYYTNALLGHQRAAHQHQRHMLKAHGKQVKYWTQAQHSLRKSFAKHGLWHPMLQPGFLPPHLRRAHQQIQQNMQRGFQRHPAHPPTRPPGLNPINYNLNRNLNRNGNRIFGRLGHNNLRNLNSLGGVNTSHLGSCRQIQAAYEAMVREYRQEVAELRAELQKKLAQCAQPGAHGNDRFARQKDALKVRQCQARLKQQYFKKLDEYDQQLHDVQDVLSEELKACSSGKAPNVTKLRWKGTAGRLSGNVNA